MVKPTLVKVYLPVGHLYRVDHTPDSVSEVPSAFIITNQGEYVPYGEMAEILPTDTYFKAHLTPESLDSLTEALRSENAFDIQGAIDSVFGIGVFVDDELGSQLQHYGESARRRLNEIIAANLPAGATHAQLTSIRRGMTHDDLHIGAVPGTLVAGVFKPGYAEIEMSTGPLQGGRL